MQNHSRSQKNIEHHRNEARITEKKQQKPSESPRIAKHLKTIARTHHQISYCLNSAKSTKTSPRWDCQKQSCSLFRYGAYITHHFLDTHWISMLSCPSGIRPESWSATFPALELLCDVREEYDITIQVMSN